MYDDGYTFIVTSSSSSIYFYCEENRQMTDLFFPEIIHGTIIKI